MRQPNRRSSSRSGHRSPVPFDAALVIMIVGQVLVYLSILQAFDTEPPRPSPNWNAWQESRDISVLDLLRFIKGWVVYLVDTRVKLALLVGVTLLAIYPAWRGLGRLHRNIKQIVYLERGHVTRREWTERLCYCWFLLMPLLVAMGSLVNVIPLRLWGFPYLLFIIGVNAYGFSRFTRDKAIALDERQKRQAHGEEAERTWSSALSYAKIHNDWPPRGDELAVEALRRTPTEVNRNQVRKDEIIRETATYWLNVDLMEAENEEWFEEHLELKWLPPREFEANKREQWIRLHLGIPRRVAERSLRKSCFWGGGLGVLAAMILWQHKTSRKKWWFRMQCASLSLLHALILGGIASRS